MDIRAAKRPEKGTKKPAVVAEEPVLNTTQPLEENGKLEDALKKYGDVTIASYMRDLEDNGITEADILELLDTLITTGSAAYETELFGRIPVRFQVRATWVNDHILKLIDKATQGNEQVSLLRFNSLVALYNLAGSLVQFGDNTYTVTKEKEFDKAVDRVKEMPYITQNALVNALSLFDKALAVATSDWAVKNFTKPRQEGSGRKR